MAVSHEIREYLPGNYTYLLDTANYKFDSEENYVATIRIKEVVNQEMAKEWVRLLSQCSYVTWRAMRTNPKSGKINVFKSDFRCHHKTRYKKVPTMKKVNKNTNCPALLKITVRRTDIRCSRATKPDPLIKEWPCIVNLSNTHNHKLQGAAILRFRDMSAETREKIVGMFKIGYSPSSVFHSLEVDVCLEHPDDFHLYEADGATLPSLPKIEHLFRLDFKDDYKRKSVTDFVRELEAFMEDWARASGGKFVFGNTEDGRNYVVLCTPLMQRVHEIVPQSGEIVLLETVGGMDMQRHRVYFFLTPTIAGGLPLGIIITNNKAEDILCSALNDFLALICPIPAFYGSNGPKVLVIDYLKELKLLPQHFPSSTVVYSQYHVLEYVWMWLKDKNRNKVEEADRQEMYSEFKSLVHSPVEDDLLNRYQILRLNCLCIKYPSFKILLDELWESRLMWASCYRTDLDEGSICANTAFRILKEALMSRVMAFKLTPLVDFIITRFETYMERKLLMFCTQQRPACLVRKFLPKIGDINVENLVVQSHEDGIFLVPCDAINLSLTCSTNVRYMTCSCINGKPQKMCQHLSAAVQRLELDSEVFCSQEAAIEKDLLLKVANFNVVTVSNQDFEDIVAGEGLTVEQESKYVIPGEFVIPDCEAENEVDRQILAFEQPATPTEAKAMTTVAMSLDTNDFVSDQGVALEPVLDPVSQNESQSFFSSPKVTIARTETQETILSTSNVNIQPLKQCNTRTAPSSRLCPILPRSELVDIQQISNISVPTNGLTTLTLTSSMSSSLTPHVIEYIIPASDIAVTTTIPSIDTLQCNESTGSDAEVNAEQPINNENQSDGAVNTCNNPTISDSKLSDSESIEMRMETSCDYPSVKLDTEEDELPSTEEPLRVLAPEAAHGYSISDVAEFMEVVQEDVLECLDEESQDSACERLSDPDEEFEMLINRIREGRKNKPDVFGPAVKKMVLSARKHASSDESLAKAMATFGKFPSIVYSVVKKPETEMK